MRAKPGNLIRLPQVLARINIGKSTLWAWVASGRFPAPIKLGPRMSVWREEEIDTFIIQAGQKETTADKAQQEREVFHE